MTPGDGTGSVARREDAERLARVTISLVAEPGDPVFAGLTHELGGAVFLAALREDADRHEELAAASARLTEVDPDRALDQAARLGVRFVMPGDEEWPAPLEDLAAAGAVQERGGPPVGLWVRGPMRLDRLTASVAVVGSRSATTYGDHVAGEISARLGQEGVPVISGAAFGIDRAAHRGSVSAGAPTAAVLACGADRVYPTAHRDLLDYLAREHAVISEAPIGAAPHRVRFLARNRIIAALSRGTVVVEAAARSGALNTANWAQRLHRPVMGVPGPVTSAASVGVHHQVRTGAAMLVTGGEDVLEVIGAAGEHLIEEPRGPEHARDLLPVRQRQVLDAVPVGGTAGTASIASVAGLAVVQVGRILQALQGHGLVDRSPTGWWLTDAGRA
ncbi:DNA-processing protein DprA [Nocardioides panacisoli]|uniref:DNA-processing protein DprA n=1 Tax=Nocardioides panacisoli TaxID=627624 RepID=UPI001C639E3D|nr:DNA-processing protein DprA [Nocardioides panacisoli]QYJ04586.1 DNA-processing protein DprA [Nocardioides panacisoli]